jgi:hypothetical protein
MTEVFQDAPKIIGLFITLGLCGAVFGLGFAGMCRLLRWAPVNVTVNVTRPDDGADR